MEPVLYNKNKHERDDSLVFDESTHTYTILHDSGNKYTSVTTWVHEHFPAFNAGLIIHRMMHGRNWNPENKYWGMTSQEIKDKWNIDGRESARLGTKLHYDIECFMNQDISTTTQKNLLENYIKNQEQKEQTTLEWNYFINFIKDNKDLVAYRTEWMIYHEELKLAGSIDMVYENPDSTLVIYDWKRSKNIEMNNPFRKYSTSELISHIPDTNLWHYSLQLNIYKALLEDKYGKKVVGLYLVRLHPNGESYECIPCKDLSSEVSELIKHRYNTIQHNI